MGLVVRLVRQEGRDSCSMDQVHWVGTPDQLVETILGEGIPWGIHQVRGDRAGPSLEGEEGREGTCWGSGSRVRQEGLEDRKELVVGQLLVRVQGEIEPKHLEH